MVRAQRPALAAAKRRQDCGRARARKLVASALTEALDAPGCPTTTVCCARTARRGASAHALATVLNLWPAPQAPGILEPVWAEVWYPRWAQQHGDVPGALVQPRQRRCAAHSAAGCAKRRCPNRCRPLPMRWPSCARPSCLSSRSGSTGWTGCIWLDDVDGLRDVIDALPRRRCSAGHAPSSCRWTSCC